MKIRYATIDRGEKRISFSTEELLYIINSCNRNLRAEAAVVIFLEHLLSELHKS